MAHALGNIAFPLGLTLLSVMPACALELIGVDMVSTSETLSLQHSQAGAAKLSDDGTRVLAKDLTVAIHLQNGETAKAGAAEGEIVIAGNTKIPLPKLTDPAGLADFDKRFNSLAGTGDILLKNKGEDRIATIGKSGTLNSTRLIWSELQKKYLLPNDFSQFAQTPGGMELRIQGNGAVINQDFSESTYFGNDEGATITITRPATEEKK